MLRLLGVPQRLQERGAGAGPRRLTQVEVRVQVEDAHACARTHARGPGQARDRGVGGLVPAAEHHGQVVGVQQPADHRAQLGLARLELARGVVPLSYFFLQFSLYTLCRPPANAKMLFLSKAETAQ